jgi:hypothetical protein
MIAMREMAVALFAFAVMASGCFESTADGDGGSGGTAGSGGTGGVLGSQDHFVQVAMSIYTSCVITDREMTGGGNTFCVGADQYGSRSFLPLGVNFERISMGLQFGCGLDTAGMMTCWGNSGLANEDIVQNPPEGPFVDLSVGGGGGNLLICGLTANDALICQGASASGFPFRGPNNGAFRFKTINVIGTFGAAVNEDRDAMFFRYASGNTELYQRQPVADLVDVYDSGSAAVAIDTDGAIYTWKWTPVTTFDFPHTKGSGVFRSLVPARAGACGLDGSDLATCVTSTENPFDWQRFYTDAITDVRFEELSSDRDNGFCGTLPDAEQILCWGSVYELGGGSASTVQDILDANQGSTTP